MSVNRTFENNGREKEMKLCQRIVCYMFLGIIIFLSTILQVTCLEFFGKIPALTFALVCASGFIFGEKVGAVSGVLSGVLTDILGNTGFSFSPIVFMLCGYVCGAAVGWFLSKNLPSFLIYATLAGLFKEIFTFVYFGLFSASFSLWKIFTSVVIPEYFAYLVCVIPAYLAVLGIFSLFKGKDKKRNRKYYS